MFLALSPSKMAPALINHHNLVSLSDTSSSAFNSQNSWSSTAASIPDSHEIWSSPLHNPRDIPSTPLKPSSCTTTPSPAVNVEASSQIESKKQMQPKQMTDAQFLKYLGYLSMYDFMSFYDLKTWKRGNEAEARTILHALRDRAQEKWGDRERKGKSEDE
jgi:hypothetical protein